MAVVIVILAVLLLGAAAFIFWLLKVLKNTFSITENLIDMAQGKSPRAMKEAYDGKYYPATVIAQVKFDQPHEGKVVDWSLYEEKKIVGFIMMTTDKVEDYYGKEFIEMLDEEDLEELTSPVIIKNALVYAVREDDWFWKLAQ
jgi:hypothetical protein